ncbi:hypothetical protein TSUD_159260 [Trifolium subterraneum]|uniref:Protein BPS1, chloroplastic n=1 Tax=Trifolium subterraneum TaxID=3900 RepID=A0A2Z6MY30_TRISU|nr:hypothetical protein TSUD_159260 [Trifolium subterraneum]
MSRPQDPPRSFFPFGNPFRMISPKGTTLSPQLLAVLCAFEATLEEKLKKLIPKSKDEVVSLSWMTSAMQALCESHNDIKTLMTDLELPVTDWEEKWIDVYLDISVKLLDICIAFSSELSRLNQGHLLLQCTLHHLGSSSSDQLFRACSSLDGWRQHVSSKNPRIEKCGSILDNLVGSSDLPKVKKSAKGKVLMQAIYGVKVLTVFVCSVFATAFSGSTKNLIDMDVADVYSWAPTFKGLQNLVNEEIRVRFSSGRITVLNELEAVDSSVRELYPIIQGVVETTETESHAKTVEKLGRSTENFSQGVDLLVKEVDGFFQVVLSGRDALLSNLRSGATINGDILGVLLWKWGVGDKVRCLLILLNLSLRLGRTVVTPLCPKCYTPDLMTQLTELFNGTFEVSIWQRYSGFAMHSFLLRSVKTELLSRYEKKRGFGGVHNYSYSTVISSLSYGEKRALQKLCCRDRMPSSV